MPKNTTNIISSDFDGVHFIPSGSNFFPLLGISSTPQTFVITASANGSQVIHTSAINPFISIPVLSGSFTSDRLDVVELFRYHTASYNLNEATFGVSSSLYFTSSNRRTKYRNIPILLTDNSATIATKTYNTFLSSSFNLKTYSASLEGDNHIIVNFLSSGSFNKPNFFSASVDDGGLGLNIRTTGSGELNFREPYVIDNNSSSLSIKRDPNDIDSIQFSVGTSSFSHSGSSENILLYASGGLGGRGRIGFGTKNPKTKFDFKGDGFKVRSIDGQREFRFEEDGRLTAKKFGDTETSESVGSEIQLSYTPGTFDLPSKAQVGETIGTLNWVDESFNLSSILEESKYLKSGSVAQITSTVRKVTPLGAAGDLQFKVNVDPTSPQETLISFINIDPHTNGATVLFPYGITATTNIISKGNISASGTITALSSNISIINGGSF